MSINSIFFKPFGLKLSRLEVKAEEQFIDDSMFMDLYEKSRPYTMTTLERMYSLYQAVRYIVKYNIPGNFVECGVWRGGSSMMIALTLAKLGQTDRQIYLYDTFEGMSEPTGDDVTFKGDAATILMKEAEANKETSVWCLATLDDVKANMALTGYPAENLHYVKGKVEDTIPAMLPQQNIALLRLDTDWYESTAHELEFLYPMLNHSGVLIIDDYGHWAGCRRAVDEYFENTPILLNRIDYTGRIAIKS
jgi:O-methyltransferase